MFGYACHAHFESHQDIESINEHWGTELQDYLHSESPSCLSIRGTRGRCTKAASLHLRSNSSRTPSYLCISIVLEPRRSTRQLLHLVVNLPSGHKQSSFAASKRLKAPPRHSQCALIVSSLGLLISKKQTPFHPSFTIWPLSEPSSRPVPSL